MRPQSIREYVASLRPRYRAASKAEKTRLLDDFCGLTGRHRKSAIRRLGRPPRPRRGTGGREAEFLNAHEHYRRGDYPEAIGEALKAFESTMKAICDNRKWPYPAKATAQGLIKAIIEHGLVPADLLSHFEALRACSRERTNYDPKQASESSRARRAAHHRSRSPDKLFAASCSFQHYLPCRMP